MGAKKNEIPMTTALRALKNAGVQFEILQYAFVEHGGTQQAASELGLDHHAIIKTIILEDENKKPFVCLMHGDREISVKQLARVRGVKTVTLCEPETADRHSGYHVGGTSPFGTRRQMKVYIEEGLFGPFPPGAMEIHHLQHDCVCVFLHNAQEPLHGAAGNAGAGRDYQRGARHNTYRARGLVRSEPICERFLGG